MVALVMEAMHHVYDARDRVYRYIATRSLPRQHRNILARYVTALKSNKRDSVDKMMSSFNVVSIASTIDALKGVKDQHIQDIASSMQSNMIRMWSNKGLSPDTLYKDLNLGKNIWNRIKKSESNFRLSNQPDFKLWVAFVNDVWKRNLGNEFEKLDDELKAMMILITGSKHEQTKVKGAQKSYINKWTTLEIDPVKEEVLVNLKKLKRSKTKRKGVAR
ncbi:unnamed protein product [Hyaloperonospora brassicae]|uniref:RxLR effector protein n=1 Tax=Hyaloperonospora brassicae TaxID=162125 RepID=A0AAV0TK92_HYABA|nr:unnamed protein product [Hyaloperonospora brassicae]